MQSTKFRLTIWGCHSGQCQPVGLSSAPVLGGLEGDVGGGVVHHGEGAHPEVVPQPGHEPELEEAHNAGVVDDGGEGNGHEGIHCC